MDILRFVVLSLALHVFMWLFLPKRPPQSPASEPIEVQVIDKSDRSKDQDKRQQQIVRQALPDLKSQKPKKADFLSERDQQVEKEMKAKNSGLTQNSMPGKPEAPRLSLKQLQPLAPKAPSQREYDQDSEERVRKIQEREAQERYGNGNTVSASGEYLPKVNEGPITALNTERFIYYSFFARIEEKLRPIWERNLRSAQATMSATDLRRAMNNTWLTEVEVLLDDKGNYLETYVHKDSGIPYFDQSVISSFRDARMFPNPPKGMIGSDGKVHLKYSFVVHIGG